MSVHLFIPCLVQDFHPEIGEATARVLARAGAPLEYSPGPACCGQPLYKAGHFRKVVPLAKQMLEHFRSARAVVSPSGSCVRMIREYPELFPDNPTLLKEARDLAAKTFELSEYLVRNLGRTDLGASLTARVAYHDSCQVGRALGLHDEPRALLKAVNGLELVELPRPNACCGFGGPFSLEFPAPSEAILEEKVQDILATGSEIVVSAEVSCLMNIRGYMEKHGLKTRVLHLAQVLDTGHEAAE